MTVSRSLAFSNIVYNNMLKRGRENGEGGGERERERKRERERGREREKMDRERETTICWLPNDLGLICKRDPLYIGSFFFCKRVTMAILPQTMSRFRKDDLKI